MADDKKKTKKSKKEEGEGGGSKSGSKKAEKKQSNVFSAFTQRQIAEFKEAFQMMDHDKDGIIGKGDLKATFDGLGKSVTDSELDALVNDSPGPINFTGLLTLFADRMSGSADEDEVVIAAFKSFDVDGSIAADNLRQQLKTFGMKFTDKDVEDAFSQMSIDGGKIDTQKLIGMLTASGGSED
jgi:Ca2+-binding EF-hand superfamily protein